MPKLGNRAANRRDPIRKRQIEMPHECFAAQSDLSQFVPKNGTLPPFHSNSRFLRLVESLTYR
jgi:hypothetical protein